MSHYVFRVGAAWHSHSYSFTLFTLTPAARGRLAAADINHHTNEAYPPATPEGCTARPEFNLLRASYILLTAAAFAIGRLNTLHYIIRTRLPVVLTFHTAPAVTAVCGFCNSSFHACITGSFGALRSPSSSVMHVNHLIFGVHRERAIP
jgi:hypothetical protein